MSKEKIGLLLLIIGVLFVLRWNSFTAPFERDEGEYAYDARVLLDGGLPYRDSNSQKPPLIFYTYALANVIDRTAVWPPRVLAFGFEVLTVFVVSLIARKKWGAASAFISVPIFALMLNFPPLAPFAANTEIFALLPLVLVMYLYVKYRGEVNNLIIFLAGFFAACSLLYKPIVLYMLVFIFVVWLLEILKLKSWRRFLLSIAATGLGGLTAAVLILGYFFYRDGLKSFWECAVAFNAAYMSQYGWGLGNFFSRLSTFVSYWWVILFLTVWYFIRLLKAEWWLAGLLLCGLLAVYTSPIGHYYLILMPVWALMITYAIFSLSEFIKEKSSGKKVYGYLVVGLLVSTVWPIANQFSLSPDGVAMWIYGPRNPFIESAVAAEKLSQITKPSDLVFVAGSEPQILHLADRKSASRFVTTYSLNMATPFREAYQKEAVAELSANPPAAIVVSPNEESGLWSAGSPRIFMDYLQDILNKDYTLVGGYVWSLPGGQWKDVLSNEDVNNASLLLYVKKN